MYKTVQNLFDGSSKSVRIALLILYDIFSILVASELALFIRFDFSLNNIEVQYQEHVLFYLPINVICMLLVFFAFQLYNSLWKYASTSELLSIILACILCSGLQCIGMTVTKLSMPRSFYALYMLLFIACTVCGRFSYRFLRIMRNGRFSGGENIENTMIVGAGDAGVMLLREMLQSNHVTHNVVCLIDDDADKCGTKLRGVPIIGGRDSIKEAALEYDVKNIIIAIPTLSVKERRDLVNICKDTGCKTKILPGIYQIVNNEVSVSLLRDVQIENLLGREPIRTEMDIIMDYVKGQVVLITGGGGSIGSEIARQVAAHQPKQLIILDIYENSAYEIQQELLRKYPDMNLVVLIASVRNTHRIDSIFQKYRPDLVYHAAAHKHVPLMETSPNEAVKNNVIGTYNVAETAGRHGTKRFVLISTDKAVNPTNIMGASKRLGEKVIQCLDDRFDTEFVAVRFGNVLGSNGSVIPLFKEQIAEGGPVTVTHRDIVRYFMTIPEAVSLVLQAGAYAKGGEIFVLDMGEPVKIDDLARNLIKLSGLRPDVDIRIVYTGLRPGEKLYEEKLMAEEGLMKTENDLIYIGKPVAFDKQQFMKDMWDLKALAYEDKYSDAIYRKVKAMAPTFQWVPKEERGADDKMAGYEAAATEV